MLSRRWPVCGSSGGKSRFRGIDTQLEGGLVGRLAEVAEEVADGLLAVADDVAGGGTADGIGHVTAELLELVLEGLGQGLGRNGGQRVHADLRTGEGLGKGSRRKGYARPTLRNDYIPPGLFVTPLRGAHHVCACGRCQAAV